MAIFSSITDGKVVECIHETQKLLTESTAERDFARARTSSQLAASFLGMMRPIEPGEDVDSDYTFS
jgi:hypothetical protein